MPASQSSANEFVTLSHELAQEMSHRCERRNGTLMCARETEAEAVAFVACSAIGLEAGPAAQDYMCIDLLVPNRKTNSLSHAFGVICKIQSTVELANLRQLSAPETQPANAA